MLGTALLFQTVVSLILAWRTEDLASVVLVDADVEPGPPGSEPVEGQTVACSSDGSSCFPCTPGDGRCDVPTEVVYDELTSHLLDAIPVAFLLLVLLSAVGSWAVARRLLAPLTALRNAAEQAASGDLRHRLAMTGPRDEISDLAHTFDRMLDSLERSFEAQRRFAANASHELRTPLATTQTMIDVALADPDATVEDLRELARRIRRINRANVDAVNTLLDLAYAQQGSVECRTVDLGHLVFSVLAEVAGEAREHDVVLSADPASVVVRGDPVLLRQAVLNLVRNAVRHNLPGGSAHLELTQREERACLVISNDGELVPQDSLSSLSEPFVRGSGRTRDGGGHGLGLAIVTAIVAAHGGRLHLSARSEGGLRVVLELPVAGPQAVIGGARVRP